MARTTVAATASSSPAKGGTGSPAVIAVFTKPAAEGADESPAPRGEARGGLLAEQHRAGEVDLEQRGQARGIGGQFLLAAEGAAGHHEGVEAAQGVVGRVERFREPGRPAEVERGVADRRARAARLQVARGARHLGRVAAEQEEGVAALGERARERAAHPAGRADEGHLHARSPRSRTDWAERKRWPGSQRSRTARHSARRGIMRAKSSARVTASLAR